MNSLFHLSQNVTQDICYIDWGKKTSALSYPLIYYYLLPTQINTFELICITFFRSHISQSTRKKSHIKVISNNSHHHVSEVHWSRN